MSFDRLEIQRVSDEIAGLKAKIPRGFEGYHWMARQVVECMQRSEGYPEAALQYSVPPEAYSLAYGAFMADAVENQTSAFDSLFSQGHNVFKKEFHSAINNL